MTSNHYDVLANTVQLNVAGTGGHGVFALDHPDIAPTAFRYKTGKTKYYIPDRFYDYLASDIAWLKTLMLFVGGKKYRVATDSAVLKTTDDATIKLDAGGAPGQKAWVTLRSVVGGIQYPATGTYCELFALSKSDIHHSQVKRYKASNNSSTQVGHFGVPETGVGLPAYLSTSELQNNILVFKDRMSKLPGKDFYIPSDWTFYFGENVANKIIEVYYFNKSGKPNRSFHKVLDNETNFTIPVHSDYTSFQS